MHLKEAIHALLEGKDLNASECQGVIQEMIGEENPYQAAAFLALLHAKGETADELLGVARAMQKEMLSLTLKVETLDIVGTGGDHSHSVNISTGAAILAAAAGALVAKHGNRASSSKCGSADVLEALGVSLASDPQESLQKHGISFLYAPNYHPAAKAIAPIRKGLGIRTIFNLVGPLLNPLRPPFMVLGVAKRNQMDLFAKVQQELGTQKTLIIYGNGMDELTPIGPCEILEVTPDGIKSLSFDPLEFGFPRCTQEDLRGGSKEENAALLTEVLKGKKGAIADSLILNAGAALYACGKAQDLKEGFELARRAQESGKGFDLLEKWREE